MDESKRVQRLLTFLVPVVTLAATLLTVVLVLIFNALFNFSENPRMALLIPLIALGACYIIGSALSTVVVRTLLRPLTDLIRATGIVSKGDFSVRVDDRGMQNQYGAFIRSFNQMVEELGNLELFRTDFINTFSHEFKTPMVSIRGYARLLRRKDLTDEEREGALDTILRESDRLTEMSANVLLLSKYENTHILSGRKRYALDEQIRQCIGLLEESWLKKDIVLSGDLDAIEYNGNEDMLDQVWLNLLSNAIKFSPQGGELSITLKRNGSRIEAAIRDCGPGMTAETASRIFDKFYKGDSSHSSEGNGLGLAIVRRILDLCGGEITVETAPGKGSTFRVFLPDTDA